MTKRFHHVMQHRSGIKGIETMTLLTEHVFPRHSHDQFGIGVVTSGAHRSWSAIGQVESQAGDVIMVNPGEMHDGAPIGGVRGWSMIYLDPAMVACEIGTECVVNELVVRPVARDGQLTAQVSRLIDRLESPFPDELATEESLLICLARIALKHGSNRPRRIYGSPSVSKAIQRLEDAPEVAASLAELAVLSGISRFQLVRGFLREVGATPHAYLIQLRVRLVRRLLAAGKSLTDASYLAGFADQSHMTRAFVRQFGITPGRYKANIA